MELVVDPPPVHRHATVRQTHRITVVRVLPVNLGRHVVFVDKHSLVWQLWRGRYDCFRILARVLSASTAVAAVHNRPYAK